MKPYPIKFEPILKEKIWGGNRLKTELNKSGENENLGESWEISTVKNSVSKVANGIYKGLDLNTLVEQFPNELLGSSVMETIGHEFPLLIKFIDANDDLSIQVHPDDQLAKSRYNSFGKTEMWYIMDAKKSSRLVLGMKEGYHKKDVENSTDKKKLFKEVPVKAGDGVFIPAGTVHAIGKGILLAEIQQTSDITFRIYDWDRQDDTGKKRKLHLIRP